MSNAGDEPLISRAPSKRGDPLACTNQERSLGAVVRGDLSPALDPSLPRNWLVLAVAEPHLGYRAGRTYLSGWNLTSVAALPMRNRSVCWRSGMNGAEVFDDLHQRVEDLIKS